MQLFVENLTVIDAAYLDAAHGLVGESWMVDVTLHGVLDEQSMVMDFSHVKRKLKAAIDGSIDHTLIVPAHAAGTRFSEALGRVTLEFAFGNNERLLHDSPAEAVTLLPADAVDHRAITSWLEPRLMAEVPESVSKVEIGLRHEDAEQAFYHYTHGLKKHDGNCQRIAHGHRSRVMIWRDGMRELDLEKQWAADWDRTYIATLADRVGEHGGASEFRYTSGQGDYALTYPTARCRFLSGDSTVESIALHIAATLKDRAPEHRFRVRAYEGVGKGAIAEA